MGKEIKRYNETDEHGEHEVIEYSNGVKVKLLTKPSDEYIKKKEKQQAEYEKKKAEKQIIRAREKLIQDKIRELAITELEKEGKL